MAPCVSTFHEGFVFNPLTFFRVWLDRFTYIYDPSPHQPRAHVFEVIISICFSAQSIPKFLTRLSSTPSPSLALHLSILALRCVSFSLPGLCQHNLFPMRGIGTHSRSRRWPPNSCGLVTGKNPQGGGGREAVLSVTLRGDGSVRPSVDMAILTSYWRDGQTS